MPFWRDLLVPWRVCNCHCCWSQYSTLLQLAIAPWMLELSFRQAWKSRTGPIEEISNIPSSKIQWIGLWHQAVSISIPIEPTTPTPTPTTTTTTRTTTSLDPKPAPHQTVPLFCARSTRPPGFQFVASSADSLGRCLNWFQGAGTMVTLVRKWPS